MDYWSTKYFKLAAQNYALYGAGAGALAGYLTKGRDDSDIGAAARGALIGGGLGLGYGALQTPHPMSVKPGPTQPQRQAIGKAFAVLDNKHDVIYHGMNHAGRHIVSIPSMGRGPQAITPDVAANFGI